MSVKILNYTPLAGRELRFTYDKVDVGHVVYNEAYPIADDGTATVRLHPCFPISAFMSVGDGPQALVLLVPGNDISILMDMDEAADGLGIKGFKGAYAKLNYEVNVKGGKDLVSYDLSNAHLDSVMRADKPLHQSLSHYQDSVDSRIRHSGFVGATYQFLNIYNDYRYLQYYHTLRAYIYEKLIKAVKDMGAFPAMDLILRADYMGWKYAYSPQLFTGERMTLCPCYYTAIQYLDPESSLNAFRDSKGNENAYNKSVCRLHDAIRHYRILSSDAGENAQLKSTVENDASQITIPELKAYFYKAIERKKRETEKGKE